MKKSYWLKTFENFTEPCFFFPFELVSFSFWTDLYFKKQSRFMLVNSNLWSCLELTAFGGSTRWQHYSKS